MSEKPLGKFEQGLLDALKAIDNQIARELQRTPAEREEFGVKKWEAYNQRVENTTSFLLNLCGDDRITLDGLIVLSQALTKALRMVAEDLELEGLGKVRTEYLQATFKALAEDSRRGQKILEEEISLT
jgi:hypothetical protein